MFAGEGEKIEVITSLPGVRMLEGEKRDAITSSLRRAARESGKPRAYREFIGPTWLRIALIVLTCGGGVTGVMNALIGLAPVVAGNGLSRAIVCKSAGFVVLSAIVLVSGVLFLNSRRFTRLLTVSLLLQVPLVSSPFVTYHFYAGLRVILLLFVNGAFGANAGAGAEFWFEYRQETAPFGVGLNLLALIMLILLIRNQIIQYE
jgi:hypothetical protein